MGVLRFAALVATLLLSLTLASAETGAPVLGQREIEEGLTCQCGCGLTVASCNHLECSFAVPVRKDIAESLVRGESGQQILERYKTKYGEKVLSSPVAEGFNLLAWIGPYLGILIAGSLMFAFFRHRAMAVPGIPSSAPGNSQDPADPRVARLQREVEELER